MRTLRLLETLRQDLGYAARALRRSPAFAAVAVITIAVGVAGTTTVFSLMNVLLLRPLPFVEADRLVMLQELAGAEPDIEEKSILSYPRFLDYREAEIGLAGVAAEGWGIHALRGSEVARPITSAYVSSNYFGLLGVAPAVGRFFDQEEDIPGAGAVAVVSHRLWEAEFGADPDIIGRILNLSGQSVPVIGVAPEGFEGIRPGEQADLWVPVSSYGFFQGDDYFLSPGVFTWLTVFGRLAPGETLESAGARASAAARDLGREHPAQPEPTGARMTRLGALRPQQAAQVARYLGMILGMALLVLLIASANVGGMFLARATTRRREMAVRLALGATRAQLVRQLLTESVLIYLLGGGLSLLLAAAVASVVGGMEGLPFPLPKGDWLDGRVILFGLGVPLIAALVFGLTPALQSTRSNLHTDLRGSRVGADPRPIRLRSAFAVGQIALSLVLLLAAGLFLRALRDGWRTELGFDAQRVATAQIWLPESEYTSTEAEAFYAELLDRLRRSPGVEAAALAANVPLGASGRASASLGAPGSERAGQMVRYNAVSADYFRTMGITLNAGRDFNGPAQDEVIITSAAARLLFTGDPLGQELQVRGQRLVVVGVVADATYDTLREEPIPMLYLPIRGTSRVVPHVRSVSNAASVIPVIRREVQALDPAATIMAASPLSDAVARQLLPQRWGSALIGVFGLIGLFLVSVGIYGVLAFDVAQRTREIGVRMALGAERQRVLRPILRRAGALIATGALVGVAAGLAVARILETLLLGVSPADPLTLGLVLCLLTSVGLIAAYLPARRATRIDPVVALRAD